MIFRSLFSALVLATATFHVGADEIAKQGSDTFAQFLASTKDTKVTLPAEGTCPQEVLLETLRKERINFVVGHTKTQGPKARDIPNLDKLTLAELITTGNARNWFRVSMLVDSETKITQVLILPPRASSR